MYYLESASMDPAWNLALEQFVFDQLGPREDCFMLWQNDRTIVVGKYQNVLEEINSTYVKEHGITVVRRLSGGGAVYHDRGNLNFTFVARDCQGGMIDFSSFCRPVVDALREMGVPAQINGRNDMTIGDKKFSGNAQYLRQGRVMHHGTLMFDSDLEVVGQALAVRPDKIQSKGLKSVRSRVTNIKPYVNDPQMTVEDFWAALRERMFWCFSMRKYQLSPQELEQVEELRKRIYSPVGVEPRPFPGLQHSEGAAGGGVWNPSDSYGCGEGEHYPACLQGGLLRPEGQRRTGGVPSGNSAGGRRSSAGIERLAGGGLFCAYGPGYLCVCYAAIKHCGSGSLSLQRLDRDGESTHESI